jgi:hypothetical protein
MGKKVLLNLKFRIESLAVFSNSASQVIKIGPTTIHVKNLIMQKYHIYLNLLENGFFLQYYVAILLVVCYSIVNDRSLTGRTLRQGTLSKLKFGKRR